MIDYTLLRVIWWILLGVLLTGFAVTDGFDLGAAALAPLLARNDTERRVLMNVLGPTWEGNQVWLILGAGAMFAAWPMVYTVSFSGFYLAMFLALGTIILRPVAFKFRSKHESARWRSTWDVLFWIGGLVPALVFGVAVGNVLQGVPFHFDADLRAFYTGGFLDLFSPFSLLAGVLSVAMLCMHGAAYLAMKTEGALHARSRRAVMLCAITVLVLFSVGGYVVNWHMVGYQVASAINTQGPSNPLHKHVVTQLGAWTQNYYTYPWMLTAPLLGLLGALFVFMMNGAKCEKLTFLCSGLSVAGIVSTVGVSMFPFILPSSTHPSMSLMVWDASSSQFTLQIMLIATIIFMPLILLYTAWVYRVMRGKVTGQSVESNGQSY